MSSMGQETSKCASSRIHSATLLIPDTVQVLFRGDASPEEEKIRPDSIAVFAQSGCVGGASWQDGAFAVSVAGWDSTSQGGAREDERFQLRVFDESLQATLPAYPDYTQCTTFPVGMQAICRNNGVYADQTVHFVRRIVLVPAYFPQTQKAVAAGPGDVSLEASTQDDAVHLEWTFAGSASPPEFAVQRQIGSDTLQNPSSESRSWETIAVVGESEDRRNTDGARAGKAFAFVDDDLPNHAEQVIYRLRWEPQKMPAQYSNEVGVSQPSVERMTLFSPFPNPTDERATVRFALPESGQATLSLYDLLGRRVGLLLQGRQPSGRRSLTIDVSQFASGTYLLRLTANGNTRTRKLQVVE